MAKVIKKEIRLTYYLENEEDKKIYEKLSSYNQPGRIVKDIVAKELKSTNTNTDVNLETLKLIEKLTNKIENLQVGKVVTVEPKEIEKTEFVKEIELNAEVTKDDLDDIEF